MAPIWVTKIHNETLVAHRMEGIGVEWVLHLSATHRYVIIKNGQFPSLLASEVSEFSVLIKMPKMADIGAPVHDFMSVSSQ